MTAVCVMTTASTSATASPLRRATLTASSASRTRSSSGASYIRSMQARARRRARSGSSGLVTSSRARSITARRSRSTCADRAHEAAGVGEGGPDDEVRRPGLLGDAGRVEQRLPATPLMPHCRWASPSPTRISARSRPAALGVAIEQLQGLAVPAQGFVGGELVEGACAGEGGVVDGLGGVGGLDRWKPSGARALRSVPRAHRPGWPPAARRRRGGRGHGAPVTGRRRGCAR